MSKREVTSQIFLCFLSDVSYFVMGPECLAIINVIQASMHNHLEPKNFNQHCSDCFQGLVWSWVIPRNKGIAKSNSLDDHWRLRGMDTPYAKGDNFVTSCWLSYDLNPSEKVYSRKKNLLLKTTIDKGGIIVWTELSSLYQFLLYQLVYL